MQLFEQGAVAVVTGGSRGIGASVVRTLAAEGVEVFFTYNGNEKRAKELENNILASGGKACARRLEITDEDQVRAFFREVRQARQHLDIFVANAGMSRDGLIGTMPVHQFREVLEINVVGTFLCCREALRLMAARNAGAMVLVSSVSALIGREGQGNYCAAKGAISAMTRTLAIEACRYGVRVNSVSPGFVDTGMTGRIPPGVVRDDVLLGRMATPDEIANAIVMAASGKLSYLVGADLIVDGGASISPTCRPRDLPAQRASANGNQHARNRREFA